MRGSQLANRMPDIRRTYDNLMYGPRRKAASFEEARDAVLAARPDAHLEGSAGFAWTFFTRDNRGVVGTMWCTRGGTYYYRVLTEGSVLW